jgi:Rrf2 family transcriptional regulator, nitric oxide-sensitive transcriptional repressor
MFSQTAEYALRAMVTLAGQPDSAQTAQQIATASQVPADYLFKVLQALSRAGLVIAHRGKRGGYSLARPASETCILDVVNAVDPIRRIKTCPLGIEAHADNKLCPLHRKLDEAFRSVEEAFAGSFLCDLTENPVEFAHVKAL